jgi:hypothetical protein
LGDGEHEDEVEEELERRDRVLGPFLALDLGLDLLRRPEVHRWR